MLISINAYCEEYYVRRTVKQCLRSILDRLLEKEYHSKNGFPDEYNIQEKILPAIFPTDNYDTFLTDKEDLYFHGSNYDYDDELSTILSDFGKKNYHVTSSFEFACKNLTKYKYKIIKVYRIPKEYIDSLNSINLTDINDWKIFVNKIRSRPEISFKLTKEEHLKNRDDYNNFILDADSHDLIYGPITLRNNDFDIDSIQYIQYNNHIPIQYAFKESTIEYIRTCKIFTIIFKE